MPQKPIANYFNTAATGWVPEPYAKAAQAFWKEMTNNASAANENWYKNSLEELRLTAAEFLDTEVNEVAFVPNFSYALTALAQALTPGMRVMCLHEDYPSLIDPFRLNGFDVHRVKSAKQIFFNTEEIIVFLLEKKIEVLAISHVQWLTGFRTDLEKIGSFCRERGIILIVDATQSMGAIPLSLKKTGADVIISSNYKWMNAGLGTGVMCVRRDFLERFPAKIRGNHSRMLSSAKWTDDASILGYEPGHLNTPGLVVLQLALEDKLHTGVESIFEHNMYLTDRFIGDMVNEKTKIVGPESLDNRSSIIALRGGESLFEHLIDARFVVSFRSGLVRVSMHYHNTEKEVDALVSFLNHYTPTY